MAKIKTTILTGFLGAGKTTLLNRVLAEEGLGRIAVIVNEYGEVGIDGQLVVETTEGVIELNNGCICCTVRGDLTEATRDLLESGREIDRLIIETSGLADPAPVLQTFLLDDVLRSRVDLDAVVTVVDARHLPMQLEHDETREQIAFADVLIINKTDLEPEEAIAAVEAEVRALNPLAIMHRTRDCAIALDKVLDVGAFDLQNLLKLDPMLLEEHEHEHDEDIVAFAIEQEGAVDIDAVSGWLSRLVQDKGKDILRLKGILDVAGERRRYVFHGIHMTLDGRPGKPWADGAQRRNQIVFIGRDLDEAALRNAFMDCMAREPAAT